MPDCSIYPAVSTLIVGIVAAFVAYQQWLTAVEQKKLATHKLKLELFDRRYKIYSGIKAFLHAIYQTGTFTEEDYAAFDASIVDVHGKLSKVFDPYLGFNMIALSE